MDQILHESPTGINGGKLDTTFIETLAGEECTTCESANNI